MIDTSFVSPQSLPRAPAARHARFSTVHLLLLMIGMLSGATGARAATLTVQLSDALSGTSIANQAVAVYEKDASGALTWKRGGITDASGRASLEVNPPAPGNVLVARTRPFALWIERMVAAGGTVSIQAGTVRVQALNGVSGAPLVGSPVTFGSRDGSGKFTGLNTVNTDAAGQLRLDPPALGSVEYTLRANSPVDGSLKFSAPITTAGDFEFKVGNPAVTVNLTDWTTNAPMSAQRVEVRERQSDGTFTWVATRETDGNGRVKLDLDGLDTGRRYVVRVKPYLQVIERDVAAAGWISIRAGRVPATVINGDNGAPLANAEVNLYRRLNALAPWQYEFRGITGTDGTLNLDPVHLGSQQYSLRAASPVDGSLKYSQIISAAGPLMFAVGNRRVTVKVTNSKTTLPIGTLNVTANEVLSNGTLGPSITRTTDTNGTAQFDLDGISQGKRYRIRTTPFLMPIERDISAPGWVDIPAGTLRVRVENGADGAGLAGREVKLYRIQPDGSRQGLRTLMTASNASLVLDPADIGFTRYQLSAISPFDNSTKFSQVFGAGGDAVFSVGSAGVTVRVRDFKSGAALGGQAVSIYERKLDGTLAWISSRNTDSAGHVRFDLEGVGSRRYVARLKPYLQWIEREIVQNGVLDVRAGNLRVSVRRGDTGSVYPSAPVKLLAVRADGEYEGVTGFTTRADGELVLDLSDLGTTQYVLRAPSPVDGSLKYSSAVTAPGQLSFVVGNRPLTVQLTDYQTSSPIGASLLQVYELHPDNSRTWITQRSTNASGNVQFDLDGLGKGRRYVLRARPFAQWLERTVSATGALDIAGGRSTVQLVDAEARLPLGGINVQARTKAADGTLSNSIASGTTDANGSVRFDPPGLGEGAVVVYVAVNPFGDGVYHYSAPSIATGHVAFGISRAEPRKLDRKPAELSVGMPRVGQRVGLQGMILSGLVRDDTELRELTVEVLTGATRIGRYTATIDLTTQRWTAKVPVLSVLPNTRLTVRVVATDRDYNATTLQFAVNAIEDVTSPTLVFRTPSEGAVTHGQGLLVGGYIRDDTQWQSVEMRLEQGTTALTRWRRLETDPATGDWFFAMPAELFKGRSALTLRARGTDMSSNTSEVSRTINIDPNGDPARHLISRITYGESPGLWEEMRRIGYTPFLDQQLSPSSIDDSALDARLATLTVSSTNALRRDMLLRAAASRRQLNEVMTWFWDNHFNTDYRRHGRVEHEHADNAAFRQHALGRFRDLLGISAKSFAMLVYLDNAQSHKRWPNENYARELLELHTMSEGYTQGDIDEVARAFTGWTVRDNAYSFATDRHDDGVKTVLGVTLPAGGGEADGERVLDLLASRPETARHVCRKLAIRFVSEAPPEALVTRCASVFLAQRNAPNQLAQAVRTLIASNEFRNAANRGGQVKDSMRFVIGAVRATDALRSGNDLAQTIEDLGQPLLAYPAPDGYPMDSASWTSPYLQRTRLEFVGRLIENNPYGNAVRANPRALLHGWPTVNTTEGVAARVLQNVNAGVFDASELELAKSVLTENGTQSFFLDAPEADTALTRLVRTALSLPRHQMQ